MKIPGLKEKKKKKTPKTDEPHLIVVDNDLRIRTSIIPPSYKQIIKEKRFWTTREIHQILSMQSLTNSQSIQLQSKDFIKLWDRSGGKCALTGYDFGKTDQFDIGVECINPRAKYHINNFRLVLFPISYSRSLSKAYTASSAPLRNYVDDRPVAKCVFNRLRDVLLKTYKFTSLNIKLHDLNGSITLRCSIRFHNISSSSCCLNSFYDIVICSIVINDCLGIVDIHGPHRCNTINLADPDDFSIQFLKIFDMDFKYSLGVKSLDILKSWDYLE